MPKFGILSCFNSHGPVFSKRFSSFEKAHQYSHRYGGTLLEITRTREGFTLAHLLKSRPKLADIYWNGLRTITLHYNRTLKQFELTDTTLAHPNLTESTQVFTFPRIQTARRQFKILRTEIQNTPSQLS